MTHREKVATAVHSSDPGKALRTVVLKLAEEGLQKPAIYELLEKFLVELRERQDYRESEEDAILDVMDALTGWCHPDAQLLPEQNIS